MTATPAQMSAIIRRAVDDTARAMARDGVHLTWSQADEIGDVEIDWLRHVLGLRVETDMDGVHCTPPEPDPWEPGPDDCADCGGSTAYGSRDPHACPARRP